MLHSLSHRARTVPLKMLLPGQAYAAGVIDLETGNQPLKTESGYRLVANGEIYNYSTPRVGEEKFTTLSDCEIPLICLGVEVRSC